MNLALNLAGWRRPNPATMDLYLGAATVVVAGAGTQSPQWHALPAGADAVALLLDQAAQACQRRRIGLNVWLSAAWARPFIAGPLTGVRHWHEALTVLAATAAEATGLAGPCAVWAAGPVHRQACLAVAMPAELLARLRQQALARAMVLRSVRPWWSAAFNACVVHAPEARLVVVDDGEALTSLQGTAATLQAASTQWPAPDAGQRSGWLARQMAARNLPAQDACVVTMMCGPDARAQPATPPERAGRSPDALPGVPLGAIIGTASWSMAPMQAATA